MTKNIEELHAALRRFVDEREVRQHNTAAIQLATDQSAWRDTFDPAADQLASDVVREMGRQTQI